MGNRLFCFLLLPYIEPGSQAPAWEHDELAALPSHHPGLDPIADCFQVSKG